VSVYQAWTALMDRMRQLEATVEALRVSPSRRHRPTEPRAGRRRAFAYLDPVGSRRLSTTSGSGVATRVPQPVRRAPPFCLPFDPVLARRNQP